ncbi:hypothetical protein [Flavobacterium sp.]|uniref:hypothetical protein n=1 Tax=Flavobacterium sp. TaxID=239 RepID=UPI003750374F
MPFPAFRSSHRLNSFFSKPLQELPLVALQSPEKIAFNSSGLPLQSGAVAVAFYIEIESNQKINVLIMYKKIPIFRLGFSISM